MEFNEAIMVPVIVIGVILVLGLAFWARYKTVSPDEAMIVTGTYLGSKMSAPMKRGAR